MPVYNEARFLPRVLASLERQSLDRNRLFFIAVDGGSTDGSAQILHTWFERTGIQGCVLTNPLRKIPISLNRGLALTRGDDIVLRLDAHTIYGETYLAEAVSALENAPASVGCIGCSQLPASVSSLSERIVAALYTNPMGLGGADFRVGSDVREVDNIYLGVWRPGLLSAIGGFNEHLAANEDGELSARIRRAGLRILRVPLPCRFLIKRSLVGTIRQWGTYGFWRATMLRENPQCTRMRHVVSPMAAVLSVALLLSPIRPVLIVAFGAYAVLVFRYREKGEPVAITLATVAYFPLVQFAFGAGMITGIASRRTAR